MSTQVLLSSLSTPGFTIPPVPPAATRYCRFCLADGKQRIALKLCDWPASQVVAVPWREIHIGDTWVTHVKGLYGKVVEMEVDRGSSGDLYSAKFWVRLPKRSDLYPYDRYGDLTVWTTRDGMTCSAPCCYRHRRHVGPNRDYCKDHWNAWTEV